MVPHDQGYGHGADDGASPPGQLVYVRNDSGDAVAAYGVLGIDGILIDPADNAAEFAARIMIGGITPAAGTHEGKFVITVEPIADGAIGRAVLAGACIAKVNVADAAHTHADIDDGSTAALASAGSGTAEILYKEAGTGVVWAVVRLRSGPAGPVYARITGHTLVDGESAVWTYSWAEYAQSAAGPGNLTDKTGGRTGTDDAYNDLEEINPDAEASTAPYGNGIFPDQLDVDGDETPDFAIGPVPDGTPVRLWAVLCADDSLIYRFSTPIRSPAGVRNELADPHHRLLLP